MLAGDRKKMFLIDSVTYVQNISQPSFVGPLNVVGPSHLPVMPNAGDTQSRILYKKLVQVDLCKKLDRVSCFLAQFYFLVQESCIKQNRALFDARNLQTRDQN